MAVCLSHDKDACFSYDKHGPVSGVDRYEQQSRLTRERLLDAALLEFSSCGFEGASTRSIAKRAGCHQPQINYHFESKEALWEATMTRLFLEMAGEFAQVARIADPVVKFETTLRVFVHYAARRPELNRIMVAEAMAQTSRLKWIVENFSRDAYERLLRNWRDVRTSGVGADIDERLVYHLFIGAASLLWANAPEAQLIDPSILAHDPATVSAHADALVLFFLPTQKSSRIAKAKPTRAKTPAARSTAVKRTATRLTATKPTTARKSAARRKPIATRTVTVKRTAAGKQTTKRKNAK
jgi:TetR/AcrR family transcriptional regulator